MHDEKQLEHLPPLFRDPSFLGMTATQFLGAFNDNLYKQLVLLISVGLAKADNQGMDKYQPIAMAIFSIPFVLFSGYAGYLSDRYRKQWIVVLCKLAEIGIMVLGVAAFASNSLIAVYAVLFLMGTHSAFFGPPKYGILPEMVRDRDLPLANGVIQMTTFLSIISGQILAGWLAENLKGQLWVASAACVAVACIGTATSLLLRRTPIAQPDLTFEWSSIAINKDTWRLLKEDGSLVAVILASSLFWMIAGVVNSAVNAVGVLQLNIGERNTSILLGFVGIGIMFGCPIAGKLSHKRVNFGVMRLGAIGMIACLGLTAIPAGPKGLLVGEWGARILLFGMGVSAGLFAVPLQVFLQVRPPEAQKGRVIGTMNFVNFIGIFLSAGVYAACSLITSLLGAPPSWTFAVCSLIMLPVAIFYRPADIELA